MLKSNSIYYDDFGFSFDKVRNLQIMNEIFEYSKGNDFKLDKSKERRLKFMIKRRMLINEISLNPGKIVNLLKKIDEEEGEEE